MAEPDLFGHLFPIKRRRTEHLVERICLKRNGFFG
jgi:hypothetical protein